MRPRRRPRHGDSGTVTAELAVVLPAVLLVTVLCAWAVGVAAVHVRCLDAARGAARELARGEPVEQVRAMAASRAPSGARVEVLHLDDDLVAVQVLTTVSLPTGWGGGPAVNVGGRVVAAREDVLAPPGWLP